MCKLPHNSRKNKTKTRGIAVALQNLGRYSILIARKQDDFTGAILQHSHHAQATSTHEGAHAVIVHMQLPTEKARRHLPCCSSLTIHFLSCYWCIIMCCIHFIQFVLYFLYGWSLSCMQHTMYITLPQCRIKTNKQTNKQTNNNFCIENQPWAGLVNISI